MIINYSERTEIMGKKAKKHKRSYVKKKQRRIKKKLEEKQLEQAKTTAK